MAVTLGNALLGASTFCARLHRADECDSKGLPLTLNSTNILGRFQRVKTLGCHPHLAIYLDARKLKNGTYSRWRSVYSCCDNCGKIASWSPGRTCRTSFAVTVRHLPLIPKLDC